MCMCGHLTVLFFVTDNREKKELAKLEVIDCGEPLDEAPTGLVSQQLILPLAFFPYFYL